MYPDENRQAIIDYILATGTINPAADGNWQFAGVEKDVNVTFESTPDARAVLGENSPISYIGDAANNFAKYGLKLPVAMVK